MRDLPFSLGTVVLGGGALLLGAVMFLGFLLPGTWEAAADRSIPASPTEVFALLDAPEGWRAWTPWPDSVTRTGPERGPGARMSWADREFGDGFFTVVEAEQDRSVHYEVEVNGGAMRTSGTIVLTPNGVSTRVEWREDGDLGHNPLMGFWAFFMEEAQSRELAKSLDRLAAVIDSVRNAPATDPQDDEAPADTGSTGAEGR